MSNVHSDPNPQSAIRALAAALRESHTALIQLAQSPEQQRIAAELMDKHFAVLAGVERTEPGGRYMDVEACAAYIGRTPTAVRQLVARGAIPHLKVGRRIQFDRERIDRWLSRHTRRGAGLHG